MASKRKRKLERKFSKLSIKREKAQKRDGKREKKGKEKKSKKNKLPKGELCKCPHKMKAMVGTQI